jgi:Zn-dependent protease with chaperone function
LEELAASDPGRFGSEHRKAVFRALLWLVGLIALPFSLALTGLAGLWWWPGYVVFDGIMLAVGLWLSIKAIRCLVLTFPEVSALTMDRGTYALLFRDINEIRTRIDAPKFDRIEFTMDLNACVTQRPQWFGLLGSKSCLYIGFPLIFLLTREEFKTVLAHEIAHISRRHGLARRRALLVQASVVNIYEHFSKGGRGVAGLLLGKWMDRFMPAVIDHGLVAGRMHEREADLIAARACGVDSCVRALVKIFTLSAIYDEDVRELFDESVRRNNFPNVSYLEAFQRHVDEAAENPQRVAALLDAELFRMTELTSSHPSLRERLQNIRGTWSGALDLRGGAAEEYLGRAHKQLRLEIDRQWLAEIKTGWRRRHDKLRATEARLHKVQNMKDDGETLYGYELMNMAAWTEELYGRKQALMAYTEYHLKYPLMTEGRFHYGRLLLANDEQKGLNVLIELVRNDPHYREEGLSIIKDGYRRKGDEHGVQWCEKQLDAFYDEMEAVVEDRFEHRSTDVFHVHELPVNFQESLYRLCGEFPGIQRLYLLRKEVKHYRESPFHVMVVAFNKQCRYRAEQTRVMAILRYVVELPGGCTVVNEDRHSVLAKRVRRAELKTAKIYDRNDG